MYVKVYEIIEFYYLLQETAENIYKEYLKSKSFQIIQSLKKCRTLTVLDRGTFPEYRVFTLKVFWVEQFHKLTSI